MWLVKENSYCKSYFNQKWMWVWISDNWYSLFFPKVCLSLNCSTNKCFSQFIFVCTLGNGHNHKYKDFTTSKFVFIRVHTFSCMNLRLEKYIGNKLQTNISFLRENHFEINLSKNMSRCFVYLSVIYWTSSFQNKCLLGMKSRQNNYFT